MTGESYDLVTPQRRAFLERLRKFREARVAEAAWMWNRQYPEAVRSRCREHGISDEEIDEGFALGVRHLDEYRNNFISYGDPCYGSWSWRDAKHPIEDFILIGLQGPACVECRALAADVPDGHWCCSWPPRQLE